MHTYKCADCGEVFKSEGHASRCPKCRCKVLIHVEGTARKAKSCGAGGCPPGCSCGGGGCCSH